MSASERDAILLSVEWLCALAALAEALGGALPMPEVVGRALDEIEDVRVPLRSLGVH